MMHSPLFQISPLFSKNFRTMRTIVKILPFSEKFLDFHPPNFPLFSLFQLHFRPYFSGKLLFPPYFDKFSPCFRQIHLLFTYFTCISFPPYFDHDSFMDHPMHVLDAPDANNCHKKILEGLISMVKLSTS